MHRVVIDAGVLVSAIISRDGAPARLVGEWLQGAFELIACPHLLAEVENVLLRPRLRKYITEEEGREFVALLERLVVMKPDPTDIPSACRDPKDDYLFALATDNDASLIVSGDKDVLESKSPVLPVLPPRKFLQLL